MIQTKFGFHWSSTFRGEIFEKVYDVCQVMAIAHLTQTAIATPERV
jgi:hypothetical protein